MSDKRRKQRDIDDDDQVEIAQVATKRIDEEEDAEVTVTSTAAANEVGPT